MKLSEAKKILNKNGYLLSEGLSEPDEHRFQNKLSKHRFGDSYPVFELYYYDEVTEEEIEFYVGAEFDGEDDVDIEDGIYIDPKKYSQETIDRVTPIIQKEIDAKEYNEELYSRLLDYHSY